MKAAAAIATAKATAKAAKKALKKGVAWKRKMIAQEELNAQKDLDGDGIVGGVGNRQRHRDELRRRDAQPHA